MKKRKTQGKKKRESLYRIFFAVVIVSIVFVCFFHIIYFPQYSSNQTSQTLQLKAAIVDHLSLTAPNQEFVQTAINILLKAGYVVDYYPGEEVDVKFYRNLPTHGCSLIILRVHSALLPGGKPPLGLFTSEPYSKTKYVPEQLTDRIGSVSFTAESSEYFGILPNFVKSSMGGRFENATVIMMGCNGLTYTKMAQAFIEKGAKVYISWSASVSASHTDQATTQLLKHLVTEKQTIEQAVTETGKEVGPDPEFGSTLLYYPVSVSNYVIPNVTSNLILNDATIYGYDSSVFIRHVHCPRCRK